MMEPDWDKLNGRYWKPIPNKEYLVEFTNPRNSESDFGKKDLPPKQTLTVDIIGVACDGEFQEFEPPKEFSTCNQTFIEGVKPLIKKAVKEGRDSVPIQLKKNDKGVYSIFSFTPPALKRSGLV